MRRSDGDLARSRHERPRPTNGVTASRCERRAARISSRSAWSSARASARSRSASAIDCSRAWAADARTSCEPDLERIGPPPSDLTQPPGVLAFARGRLSLAARGSLGRLGFREQLGGPQSLGRDASARVRNDRLVQAEALGGLQRVRHAGASEHDPVERRMRHVVEAGRRVRRSFGRARPLLELRMVRRHDGQARLSRELRQDGLCERAALGRVRARMRARR